MGAWLQQNNMGSYSSKHFKADLKAVRANDATLQVSHISAESSRVPRLLLSCEAANISGVMGTSLA